MTSMGIGPDSVDLLIDMGPLIPLHEATYILVARTVLPSIPTPGAWRSLTLAGSAFPADARDFAQNSVGTTPRTEWRVWSAIAAIRSQLPRMPTFGDYAISHPEYADLDFRIIKMSAQLRYTHEVEWLIVRGRTIRRGEPSQYPDLARALVRLPQYCGAAFSWGDRYIQDCANGTDGPGSATTWRQVGTNHHLTYVVRQIANHPGLFDCFPDERPQIISWEVCE